MRARAVVVAMTAAVPLATPAAAPAADITVTMPGRFFSPARVTALPGDALVFRNADFAEHDVRARDGAFESGRLRRGGVFRAPPFAALGSFGFVCTLHLGMTGEASVVPALIAPPARPVLAGEPLTLSGRVPAGTGSVTIERAAGGGWAAAAEVAPGGDGAFQVEVRPAAGTRYRATTAAGAGSPVDVAVVAALRPRLTFRRGVLRVAAGRAAAGERARLQRYSRERFGWRPLRTVRLDARGRASLRVALRGTVRVVVRGARSAPLRLPSGRRGTDPTAHDMPPGAHPGGDPDAHE